MRRTMWVLAASMLALPVASQAAIIVSVVDDRPLLPGTNDFIDVVVFTDDPTQITQAYAAYQAAAELVGGPGNGLSFISPPKRTDALDGLNPPIEQFLASGAPAFSGTADRATANAVDITLVGDTISLLPQGLLRIPVQVAPNAAGQYTIRLIPLSEDAATGVAISDANLNPADVTLVNGTITVVPEPASIGLLAVGALVALRRRRTA